jgi:hypothetical protein
VIDGKLFGSLARQPLLRNWRARLGVEIVSRARRSEGLARETSAEILASLVPSLGTKLDTSVIVP